MQLRPVITVVLTAVTLLQTLRAPDGIRAQQTPGELEGGAATRISPQAFRWQRTITPPLSNPLAEACVILDADTFSNAAPALRDLRLYQDGNAVPYAIEQSFDERALTSGVTPADDRSFYEPSGVTILQPRPLPATARNDLSLAGMSRDTTPAGIVPNSRPHEPASPGEIASAMTYSGESSLSPHIPVERIRTEPAPDTLERVSIAARERDTARAANGLERFSGNITPALPALPFTLGANLQNSANISVAVAGSHRAVRRVVFEMRRRSLCYQPRSASPLTLYLGGGNTMPAESYGFARTFQSSRERATATIGPLLPNPLFHPQTTRSFRFTRSMRATIAILALLGLFLFNTQRLLRRYGTRKKGLAIERSPF